MYSFSEGGVAEQETYSDFITPGGRGIQGVVSNFALSLFPIKSRNEGSTKGHQGVGGIQGVFDIHLCSKMITFLNRFHFNLS